MWDIDGRITSDIGEYDKKLSAEERLERMKCNDIKWALECSELNPSGLNPFLRSSICTAREFDNWFFWHNNSLDYGKNNYHSLSELEKILEKYAEKEVYTNDKFNVFMHEDDKIEELIQKAKKNGEDVPVLSEEAKVLRREKYNCGNYKPRKINCDDYSCV